MRVEKIYCDRCKKELTTGNRMKIYKKRYVFAYEEKKWNETQKELCEDCYKGFLNWMGE